MWLIKRWSSLGIGCFLLGFLACLSLDPITSLLFGCPSVSMMTVMRSSCTTVTFMGPQASLRSAVSVTSGALKVCLRWYVVSSIVSRLVGVQTLLLHCSLGPSDRCAPLRAIIRNLFPGVDIYAAVFHMPLEHILVAELLSTSFPVSFTQFSVENSLRETRTWHPCHVACPSKL